MSKDKGKKNSANNNNDDLCSMIEKILNDKLDEYNKSITLMAEKFDEAMTEMKTLRKENLEMRKEMTVIKKENDSLKKEIYELKTSINEIEGKQLERQIEIVGVPEEVDENLKVILQRINTLIKNDNTDMNIDHISRAKFGKKGQRNIICELKDKEMRDKFIRMSKLVKKNLTLNQIMNTENRSPFYVNEMISRSKKTLLKEIKTVKEKLNIKFVWVSKGEILVRKTENDKAIVIKSLIDIEKCC